LTEGDAGEKVGDYAEAKIVEAGEEAFFPFVSHFLVLVFDFDLKIDKDE